MPKTIPEIFISYRREERSIQIVHELERRLKESKQPFRVITDENDIAVHGDISAFMNRLGTSRFVIVVLSREYLESRHCMNELLGLSKNRNIKKRIFPIVFPCLVESQDHG